MSDTDELFAAAKLGAMIATFPNDRFHLRPLQRGDFDKGPPD